MNVLVVTGSHRLGSESGRIAGILKERFLPGHFEEINMHALADMRLPFWDEGVLQGTAEWATILDPIRNDMAAADAFVFVCPEWSGMAAPMLKNYFLFGNSRLMGHKPSLLVAVSSSLGGSYPIQELRGSSYKNTRICHIPDHVIVRNVKKVYTGDDPEGDEKLTDRFTYCASLLAEYAKALLGVRKADLPWDRYPNGM